MLGILCWLSILWTKPIEDALPDNYCIYLWHENRWIMEECLKKIQTTKYKISSAILTNSMKLPDIAPRNNLMYLLTHTYFYTFIYLLIYLPINISKYRGTHSFTNIFYFNGIILHIWFSAFLFHFSIRNREIYPYHYLYICLFFNGCIIFHRTKIA